MPTGAGFMQILFDKRLHQSADKQNEKIFTLFVLVCGIIGVYIFKLFSMQFFEGANYRSDATNGLNRSKKVPVQRGEIFDRNAVSPLVSNTDLFTVYIMPSEIPEENYDAVVRELAKCLNVRKQEIDSKMFSSGRKAFSSIEIKSSAPLVAIRNIAENSINLPGVSWRSKLVRNSTDIGSLSHIIGYTGNVTDNEIKILHSHESIDTSIVGKTGIEKQYDLLLRGETKNESRIRNTKKNLLPENLTMKTPEAGKNLVLTLDTRIQRLTEAALGARVGAAVVLKPASGEILAMVSYPYFDTNILNSTHTVSNYTELMNMPNNPLLNRAINAAYPPASTFKVVMSAALLEEKAFPKDKKIYCEGTHFYGDKTFHCHVYPRGHGYLDLKNGLAQSCNIYFWTIGTESLGIDKIVSYAREFRLETNIDIDLPNVSAGFVPTASWKEAGYRERLVGGDTMSVSVGQGFMLATPLHIANMTAMVANKGNIYKPHLLKEVRNSKNDETNIEIKPEVMYESTISVETWKLMQSYLRYVVTNGSAQRPLTNSMVQIAGKTGTAEVAQYKNQWGSWFVAYAPFNAPPENAVVVCVLVEAVNTWEWWAPYAANVIFQGIFMNQSYDEALDALGFRSLLKPAGRRE
jgi:penicillin-binding protein 2